MKARLLLLGVFLSLFVSANQAQDASPTDGLETVPSVASDSISTLSLSEMFEAPDWVWYLVTCVDLYLLEADSPVPAIDAYESPYTYFGLPEVQAITPGEMWVWLDENFPMDSANLAVTFDHWRSRAAYPMAETQPPATAPAEVTTTVSHTTTTLAQTTWQWVEGQRQGQPRAKIVAAAGATTESAALFAKLAPVETGRWLRDSAGNWIMPNEVIEAGSEFDIPNTFVIGVGSAGFATTVVATWQNRLTTALENRGFYVETYRFDVGTAEVGLEKAAGGKNVWGVALFGHGYKDIKSWLDWSPDPESASLNGGLVWSEGAGQVITPREIEPHQRYGLAVMYFCYADLQDWASLVSPNGKYYGGQGMVSALSGPRTLGYWGSWDGLVGTATDGEPSP